VPAVPEAARGDTNATSAGEAVVAEQQMDESNATAEEVPTLGSAMWPGGYTPVCTGHSFCKKHRDNTDACKRDTFWGCQVELKCSSGYCGGDSMCAGKSVFDCQNDFWKCTWKCQWCKEGKCVRKDGGRGMCESNRDASSCETSIFGCKWESTCRGGCSGHKWWCKNYKTPEKCVNSYGCYWHDWVR